MNAYKDKANKILECRLKSANTDFRVGLVTN